MLKKLIALSAAVALCFSAAGCSTVDRLINDVTNTQPEYPVSAGHEVIENAPSRVVVLDDNVADILIACGYTDKIVGRSADCTQKELKGVKEYGSDKNPKSEAVNKLNADVVFASTDISYSDYEDMRDSDTIVLRVAPAATIEDLEPLYVNICRVMNGNVTGEKVGKKSAESILKSLSAEENKNSVINGCYLYDLDGKSAVTCDMFENTILEYAGVQNIADEGDVNGKLSNEKIVAADKQGGFAFYILCEKGLKSKITKSDEFKNTNAVHKNRVIEIPSVYLTRQGNTAVQGVKYIAEKLKKGKNIKGESLAADFGVELYEGIFYTLNNEDSTVLAVQQRLDELGYLSINPTGFYGESTARAVKEFQVNNELNRRDGAADYETLKRLFSTAAYPRSTPIKESTSSAQQPQATEPATFSVTVVE